MSLRQRYEKWSSFQKDLFIFLCIALAGSLISIIFIFLDNIGVLLGWLLGSAVNIFAYVTLAKGAAAMMAPEGSKASKRAYLAGVFAILRIFFYAASLLLAGFASFKWGSLAHGYCNIISCALALMPNWIVLLIVTFGRMKKAEVKDQPKEEEQQ